MKKHLAVILTFALFTTKYADAQISIGSQTSVTIKIDQDINLNDPGGIITLRNVTLETSGNISFSNANIILINSNIKCSGVDFTSVRSLSVSKTVNINCNSLIFPAIILPLTGNGSDAKLSIVYKSNFIHQENYKIPASTDFSVSITKGP